MYVEDMNFPLISKKVTYEYYCVQMFTFSDMDVYMSAYMTLIKSVIMVDKNEIAIIFCCCHIST